MAPTVQREIVKELLAGITVTGIFFLVSISLPVIGFISYILIPLPILFYRLKLGRKFGLIILGISALMIGAVAGGLTLDFFLFTGLLLLGASLSECIERDLPIDKTILYSTGGILAAGFIGLLFYSQMIGHTVLSLTTEYIGKNLELTIALYKEMGMTDENIIAVTNSLSKIKDVIVRILPALVVSSFFFIAWVNLLTSKAILKKKGLTLFNRHAPLNQWRAPDHLVWGVIGSGMLLFISDRVFRFLGLNGLIIFMSVYFYQGIAIIAYFFEKKGLPKPVRVLIYSVIAFQQIILLVVIMFGFFDNWVNFRKIGVTEKNQDEE